MNNFQIKYRKTFEELEAVASKFWPLDLLSQEEALSIIPLLLGTQDQFLDILCNRALDLERLFGIVDANDLPANVFVKHLAILADVGGEKLQRISSEFRILFPKRELNYYWRGEQHIYAFKAIPQKAFNNKSLEIDGKGLIGRQGQLIKKSLSNLQKDAIALLLFGSSYIGGSEKAASALARCVIGNYLGKRSELTDFVKQRYIWVTNIIKGATANTLGQLAQKAVGKYIKDKLPNLKVKSGGRLPRVTHTDPETGLMTSFDLVVTDGSKYVAIEVGFQETTNSPLERKSRQAKSRFEQINEENHAIAYVIDGAGMFNREAAIRDLCYYSHCTVAFKPEELDILCSFIKEFLADSLNIQSHLYSA